MPRNIPVFEWIAPPEHAASTVAYLAIAVPTNHHVIGTFNLRDSLAHILDTPPALFTTNDRSSSIQLCILSNLEELGEGLAAFEVHAIPCNALVCDRLHLFHPEIPTDSIMLKSFLESVLASYFNKFLGVIAATAIPAPSSGVRVGAGAGAGAGFFQPSATPAGSPISEVSDSDEEEELTSTLRSFHLSGPST